MGNALRRQRRSCESTSCCRGDHVLGSAELRARACLADARNPPRGSHASSVCVRAGAHARYAHAQRAGGSGIPRSRLDPRGDQAARATRAARVRLRPRALNASHELALSNVSDKVRDLGGAMANKRTPAKKATKKRTPARKAAKKRASKAPAKKRTTKGPAKSSRPTKPAKPRAKKKAAATVPAPVSAPVSVPVPVPVSASVPVSAPAPAPASRPPSYLEGVPHDHAELVSGLLQVVRGAAKDLKTLVTQAIAMTNQKNDPFDR